ncbi:ABC transporter substrate-binding protein [Rhizobium sp. C4]|uniref:ABC transporter substrate-binding protein n=1 Tax=Rhizobium sp. C4 TaxID=1349800 RepID=UPI001E2EC51B|nr:ABC transporter substrate-binding protein [Rhizobium sp. C4]MCD2175563.1 ABC transporter substrate-binding protein [Rhizobium sp. C4]
MKIFKSLALSAAALLLGAGAALSSTITDVLDRKVEIAAPPQRILLGFNFEDFMAVGGPGSIDRVVAVSAPVWRDWRPAQYAAYVKAIPSIADKVDVGDAEAGTFSVEKAISARPDLVILAAWQFKALGEAVKQFEAAGVPVVVIDYNAQTLDKHLRSTTVLGDVLGQPERAKQLGDFYKGSVEDTIARVKAAQASESGPPKKVYVELAQKGPGEFGNSYGDTMWAGVIDMAGGTNIAKGQVGNWGPLRPEYVLAAAPDAIFLSGSEWLNKPQAVSVGFGADPAVVNQRIAAYLKRPGWDQLPAVKMGEVHAVYHGGTRTLSDFVYVRYMAKVLHPKAFADVDPNAEIRAFYKTWLPIEAKGVFIEQYKAAVQ